VVQTEDDLGGYPGGDRLDCRMPDRRNDNRAGVSDSDHRPYRYFPKAIDEQITGDS